MGLGSVIKTLDSGAMSGQRVGNKKRERQDHECTREKHDKRRGQEIVPADQSGIDVLRNRQADRPSDVRGAVADRKGESLGREGIVGSPEGASTTGGCQSTGGRYQ